MVIRRRPNQINIKSFPSSAFVFINTARFQPDDKPKVGYRHFDNSPAIGVKNIFVS